MTIFKRLVYSLSPITVAFFAALIPFEVKSQPVSCSSILIPGTEIRYVTAINNEMTGYGLLQITSNIEQNRWSGTQVHLAGGGTKLNLNGTMDGSSFVLFNPPYGETWTGECNGRGIAGKVSPNNHTFIFFKQF